MYSASMARVNPLHFLPGFNILDIPVLVRKSYLSLRSLSRFMCICWLNADFSASRYLFRSPAQRVELPKLCTIIAALAGLFPALCYTIRGGSWNAMWWQRYSRREYRISPIVCKRWIPPRPSTKTSNKFPPWKRCLHVWNKTSVNIRYPAAHSHCGVCYLSTTIFSGILRLTAVVLYWSALLNIKSLIIKLIIMFNNSLSSSRVSTPRLSFKVQPLTI